MFHTDRIQTLIAQIEDILGKGSKSRFGWLVGDTANSGAVLERVRNYLEDLREELAAAQMSSAKTSKDTADDRVLSVELRAELAELQQQRQALLAEIEQLKQQRQDYSSVVSSEQIFTEFSQNLINRLQESVQQQVAETLCKIKGNEAVSLESAASLETDSQVAEVIWPSQIVPTISEQSFLMTDAQVRSHSPELSSELGIALPYAGAELWLEIAEDPDRSLPLQSGASAIEPGVETSIVKTPEDELFVRETPDLSDNSQTLSATSIKDSPLFLNDTISALTDLIEHPALKGGISPSPASLEEDVLTKDSPEETENLDIWQSQEVAEQLDRELSNEEQDLSEIQEETNLVQPIDPNTSIDSDLAAAVEQEKLNFEIPEHILAEFEDLFGDSTESSEQLNNSDVLESEANLVEAEKKN